MDGSWTPYREPSGAPTVGVVIPFFQRRGGLLRNALESVARQKGLAEGEFRIVVAVVDDSSPAPLEEELKGFEPGAGVEIWTCRQANGGPGKARNKGLELVERHCDMVAFLDSDDIWADDHLQNALTALNAGADFYFSKVEIETERGHVLETFPDWFVQELDPIDAERGVSHYRGEADRAIVLGLAMTPTVVYRAANAVGTRFPLDFYRFGEDQHFYLTLLSKGYRVAAARRMGAHIGKGVNIYSGNRMGSIERVQCLEHEIAYRRRALADFSFSERAENHMANKLREARRFLAYEMLRHLTEGRPGLALKRMLGTPRLLADTVMLAVSLGLEKLALRR